VSRYGEFKDVFQELTMIHTTTISNDGTRLDFASALNRAKADFIEMPGLQLTLTQARRLWTLDPDLCEAVLRSLVESRFLVRSRHQIFARAEG
jgi:hypothetical protein